MANASSRTFFHVCVEDAGRLNLQKRSNGRNRGGDLYHRMRGYKQTGLLSGSIAAGFWGRVNILPPTVLRCDGNLYAG